MKINSKIHGVIDYLVVVFLWIGPSLFQFPSLTSLFTYILGGIHLALTLSTQFELGIIKVVPLRWHGWVELSVSLILVPVAFYFGG